MSTEVGDLLAKALNEMRTRGWVKGDRHASDGRVCALGAFECVYGYTTWELVREAPDRYGVVLTKPLVKEAERALVRAIPDAKGDWLDANVAEYNNTRTDFSEIEEWFSKAIAEEGVSEL